MPYGKAPQVPINFWPSLLLSSEFRSWRVSDFSCLRPYAVLDSPPTCTRPKRCTRDRCLFRCLFFTFTNHFHFPVPSWPLLEQGPYLFPNLPAFLPITQRFISHRSFPHALALYPPRFYTATLAAAQRLQRKHNTNSYEFQTAPLPRGCQISPQTISKNKKIKTVLV